MGAFKNPLATAFRLGHSDLKMPVGKSSAAAALPGREGAHRGGGAVRGRAWAGVAANKFSRSLNATNLFRKHAAAMAPMGWDGICRSGLVARGGALSEATDKN